MEGQIWKSIFDVDIGIESAYNILGRLAEWLIAAS